MNGAGSNPIQSENWMSGYRPPEGFYDETLNPGGQPRPLWGPISERFGCIDADSWVSRERQLQRLIADNGITYNVFGEDEAPLRPWTLDLLPLVISQTEFDHIESALAQRVHLLNLILQDVYGRQTMLQGGKMHPYLVFANPSFLRPCHGLLPANHRHIHLYAADLARAPDGNWWVLADRVESASGLGYAVENRVLMSRVLPQVMRDTGVHSLQPFIRNFCRSVESLAPQSKDSPNIALLTAGPQHDTYFEQSFLARNLGYSLVEGADLTVRNNRLFMKTIGGVQSIDVLLRRVDSRQTDPLELENESLLGVPGLLNVVRQGNVSMANALGSGFVETTAMLAFLPWFSRNYLGEDLEMPSVATWWCGQPRELEYVIDNIDSLAIKPTFWTAHAKTSFGPLLTQEQKLDLIEKLRRNPERFCAQEIVSHATIPVVRDRSLEHRHFRSRVFLMSDGNGWRMMPGGLVRYASEKSDLVVSMQRGGHSKDTWVIQDHTRTDDLRVDTAESALIVPPRQTNDLPSRVAENLFWLGRYVERTEAQARLLRVISNLLINESDEALNQIIGPFLEQIEPAGTPDPATTDESAKGAILFAEAEQLTLAAALDHDNPASLVSNLEHIERAAGKVKELLSIDTWRRLRRLKHLDVRTDDQNRSVFDDGLADLIDGALDNLASFVGNLTDNMTRTHGWRFLQVGRRLERGLSIAQLFKSVFSDPANVGPTQVSALLEWADSSITYRRRYLNALRPERALDLLCFDETNPRSLAFQAAGLRELLAALPHADQSTRHPIDTCALRLYSRLGLSNSTTLLNGTTETGTDNPAAFFDAAGEDLAGLSVSLVQTYFAHTALAREKQAETLIA